MAASARTLSAGRVGRPHGLDGSFYVTRPKAALLAAGTPLSVGEIATSIERRAGTDEQPIVRLAGRQTREDAEALRGEDLLVALEDAPALEEGEWWPEQLEGCSVVDGERPVGVVKRMLSYPSCELLEVERPGAADLLVPMVADAVRSIDAEAKRIEVDLAFLGEDAT